MGVQAYSQVQHDPKMKPSTDPREIDPVKRVAARVIEAAKHSKYSEIANQFEWEVTVIKDDKTMNAFALPGGKIAVYTGIFPVAKTEAGLAAVMGHEVVHALARHGGERMSQNALAQTTPPGDRRRARGQRGESGSFASGNGALWGSEPRWGSCSPSVGSTSRKPITSVCCSRLKPGMTLANPFDSGHAWANCPEEKSRRNSCRPIRIMKPESSSSKSGWPRPCRSTSRNHRLPTENSPSR